jgi:uncharacterized phage infection (PIP) family protein YhgE
MKYKKKLEEIKNELKKQGTELNDSIKTLEMRINLLKSKQDTSTDGKTLIARVGTTKKSFIKDKPSFIGNTVSVIERYKMVNVYEEGYWLIERDSIRGFVA